MAYGPLIFQSKNLEAINTKNIACGPNRPPVSKKPKPGRVKKISNMIIELRCFKITYF